MNTDGLRGFASLRTQPLRPMAGDLQKPKRRCTVCGAVLRQSNPGPTCATQRCSGICCDELSDFERTLVESSPHGTKAVATMRQGQGQGQRDERNQMVREFAEAGMSRSDIAERFGLCKGTVNDIIWRRYGGGQ